MNFIHCNAQALSTTGRVAGTAPSFDEHVLQAIDETDELLLITTLDVPTYAMPGYSSPSNRLQ